MKPEVHWYLREQLANAQADIRPEGRCDSLVVSERSRARYRWLRCLSGSRVATRSGLAGEVPPLEDSSIIEPLRNSVGPEDRIRKLDRIGFSHWVVHDHAIDIFDRH